MNFSLSLIILLQVMTMHAAIHIDPDLEKHVESNFETSLSSFMGKGGSYIVLEGEVAFKLLKEDVVFPSCSGANNRSQTLWNLLREFGSHITLMAPHATRYGLDPYNGKANWHRTYHFRRPDDQFIEWAGVAKTQKFGWDQFESWLTKSAASDEELDLLWNYYTENYYNPSIEGRRVYITFAQNAHAHLFRLSQTNCSLDNVVLLSYPLPDLIHDPLPEWNSAPRSKQSYINLAAIIARHLDFIELTDDYLYTMEDLHESGTLPLSL